MAKRKKWFVIALDEGGYLELLGPFKRAKAVTMAAEIMRYDYSGNTETHLLQAKKDWKDEYPD